MDHLTAQNLDDASEQSRNLSFQKFLNSNKPSVNTSDIKYQDLHENDNYKPTLHDEYTHQQLQNIDEVPSINTQAIQMSREDRKIENDSSLTPKINHKRFEQFMERNLAWKQSVENKIKQQTGHKCLNKPKLNVTSIILASNRKNREGTISEALYNEHYSNQKSRIQALTTKIEEENEKFLKECTFTPKIQRTEGVATGNIFERTLAWKHSIDNKIQQKKKENEIKEIEECSKTKLTSPVDTRQKNSPEKEINKKGLTSFYKRMNDAKLNNILKSERLNKYSGRNWQNQKTIASPYNLSTSNAVN